MQRQARRKLLQERRLAQAEQKEIVWFNAVRGIAAVEVCAQPSALISVGQFRGGRPAHRPGPRFLFCHRPRSRSRRDLLRHERLARGRIGLASAARGTFLLARLRDRSIDPALVGVDSGASLDRSGRPHRVFDLGWLRVRREPIRHVVQRAGRRGASRPVDDDFAGNALFLQTILVPVLGTNGPLWSLAYEFWYYAVFPLFGWAWHRRGSWRTLGFAAAGAAMLISLPPAIQAGFVVWLLGGSPPCCFRGCARRRPCLWPSPP